MHVKTLDRENLKFEYDLYAQRNFPWKDVVDPPFGGAWCVLHPGETSAPHNHDEKEVFIIVKGKGLARGDEKTREVITGDVIYFTPFTEHCITNIGEEPLEFVSLWWDGQPQNNENEMEYQI